MITSKVTCPVTLFALVAGLSIPNLVYADFIDGSTADLELRNFYFNGDNRQSGATQSKAEEWAQGFILQYESGFTRGPIGFGVDALGLLGVKLDSSPDRTGTGLLPVGPGGAPDEYSQLGLTAKANFSASTLRVGTLTPKLPTVLSNNSRTLPQTFQGAHLVAEEVTGLTLTGGRLTQNSLRNSSSNNDMIAFANGSSGGQYTDKFDFAGVSYDWSNNLTTTYNYGHLRDNYKQHIVNLTHSLPIAEGQLFKSDLRYARSTSDGRSNVDNNAVGAMFTYSLNGHGFGLGYQEMSGDTGFAYINGTDAFLVNYVMIAADFANPDESSYQARYDYNFAAMGLPGLTFMTRYIKGDSFEVGGRAAKEWERNMDISYVVQQGPLKNLGVRWLNGTYRSNFNRGADQNRVVLSYTISLL